jgi:hypothetical protein
MGTFNDLTFVVLSCKETENNDFHIKLQYKGSVEVADTFGTTTQDTQLTFYRFVDSKIKVGTKGKIDFAQFTIEEREFDTGEELVMLKYLKPKKS